MICPHCSQSIESPVGWPATVSDVPVVMVTCPYCQKVLGVVNAS
jgi:hypothetical protein